MNIKKNPEDSFSGIPAIVLGSNEGITTKNAVEINAIMFFIFLVCL